MALWLDGEMEYWKKEWNVGMLEYWKNEIPPFQFSIIPLFQSSIDKIAIYPACPVGYFFHFIRHLAEKSIQRGEDIFLLHPRCSSRFILRGL